MAHTLLSAEPTSALAALRLRRVEIAPGRTRIALQDPDVIAASSANADVRAACEVASGALLRVVAAWPTVRRGPHERHEPPLTHHRAWRRLRRLSTIRELRKRDATPEITLVAPRAELHYLPAHLDPRAACARAKTWSCHWTTSCAANGCACRGGSTGLTSDGRVVHTPPTMSSTTRWSSPPAGAS